MCGSVNLKVGKDRMAGILMPVASLPSAEGIGSFGKAAYQFVDMLAEMGIHVWQILPLNPLGYGNSPYQPFSSYAGDELYIDLGQLEAEGLLGADRVPYAHYGQQGRLDYPAAKAYKAPYLRQAFHNFRGWEDPAFIAFREMDWVYPYAVFVALKKQNDMRCWNEWPAEQQNWILDHQYDISHLDEEIHYQLFAQYMFYKQWMALKTYANERNVLIMGDVPFYVGLDSLDVWSSREDFLLDEQWRPSYVAGVPPDYFSATGQRWGNPIYNWEVLEQKNFSFWINRLRYSSKLYDVIRIDHFRAFDTYWKIVGTCDTAIEGEWVEAPGYAMFDELYRQMPNIQIVAEDLGELRPEVLVLRDHYDLLGMNVVQFNLPHNEEVLEHQLIYSGTHDNQTVTGWYNQQDDKAKAKLRKVIGKYIQPTRETFAKRVVRFAYGSKACLAIVPLSDILGLDDEARLNTPGTVGSPNWEWCLENFNGLIRRKTWVKEVVESSNRK